MKSLDFIRNIALSLLLTIILSSPSFSQNALDFDGNNDYVALPANYNAAGAITELTACAWVKALPEAGGWSIIDFDRSEYFNLEIGWNDRTTNVVNFATTGSDGTIHDMAGSTNVRDGYWHFVAAVFDGTDKRIYIDGVLDATATNPHVGLDIGTGLTRYGYIGDGSESTSFNGSRNDFYFDGQIDELSVWSEAKNLTELNDIMANGIPNPASEANLFLYYKFDDGSGQVLSDSGPNNHDGQLGSTTSGDSADPSWVLFETDYAQYAFDFDGSNDHVLIPNSDDINTTDHNSRTIEVWFYANDISKSTEQVIYEEGGTSNGLNIYIQNNTLYLGGWSENNSWAGTYLTSSAISSQKWHHAAIVLDNASTPPQADKFIGYLDGSLIGSGTGATLDSHSGDISIGSNGSTTQFHTGDDSSAGEYFEGLIDELRIWNDNLTINEIRTNIHRELPNPESNALLVAYFKFNETTGNILNDLSGKSNHGSFNNISWADWTASTAPIPYYSVSNGNWDATATWANGQFAPVNDWARVNIGNEITINTAEIVEELTIETGASLTINPDQSLTVNGTLTNNAGTGGLLVEADATGMGSLISPNSGVQATVETYLNSDMWHFVSSPVSNALSGVFTGLYLIEWSESDSTWTFIEPVNYPLDVTEGYGVWASSSNATVSYEGSLTTVNQNPTLSFNNNAGEGHGWNMIGNPFSSSVEWTTNWASSNIDETIYVYDGTSGNYLTWNRTLGTGTKSNGVIQVGQGFWVKANNSGPTLTIPESERLHSTEAFYKNQLQNVLTISVDGKQKSDKALLHFNKLASEYFDSEYDAHKIFGDAGAPQLYFPTTENELAVNVLPMKSGNFQIPMNFQAGTDGIFTLNFGGTETLDIQEVLLEDKKNLTITNLYTNTVYSFAGSVGDDPNRFVLHFKSDPSPGPGNSNDHSGQVKVFSEANNVVVDFQHTEFDQALVKIYNFAGQKLASKKTNGESQVRIPVSTGPGYYLIKVEYDEKIHNSKVLITN